MYFHCLWGTYTNTAYYLSLLRRTKYAVNWQSVVDYETFQMDGDLSQYFSTAATLIS